jgi:hypothetical protein
VVEFQLSSSLLPIFVVEVLLSPGVVVSGGLDVPKRISADPDVRPSGGYRQGAKPIEQLLILDRVPISIQEAKTSPVTHPPQARS